MIKSKIAIIYGSDTGTTDYITEKIVAKLNLKDIDIIDVYKIELIEFKNYNTLILGTPTWNIGDLQSDWDDIYPDFKKIDFTGIKVGFYALGDQFGYPDNFVDGLGILAEVVKSNGGDIFGFWNNKNYNFKSSKGISSNGKFYGLVIDEDNQENLTDERIDSWVIQIKKELNIETI